MDLQTVIYAYLLGIGAYLSSYFDLSLLAAVGIVPAALLSMYVSEVIGRETGLWEVWA